MDLMNYALASVFVYLGLFVGFILALIAKEELEAGKGYFIFLRDLIFSLIIFFLLYFNNIQIWLSILVAALILFFLVKSKISPVITYLFLAFVFNSAFRGLLKSFIIESSLIFIYGIPIGTLLTYRLKNKKLKSIKEIMIKYGIFVPITIGLFFL